MKKLSWAKIIMDLIYIALGVVFVIRPEGVESVLCYILAAMVTLFGLAYLVGFFIQKADEDGHREGNGFVLGILLIILAIFIVAKQDLVITLVPFLFGVMVLVRGLMVIQLVFVMRRKGFPIAVPLISSLLTMALGILVMLFPVESMTTLFIMIGIGLIVGGISGIVEEILMWHYLRQFAHEVERARDMAVAQAVSETDILPAGESNAKAGQPLRRESKETSGMAVEPDLDAYATEDSKDDLQ